MRKLVPVLLTATVLVGCGNQASQTGPQTRRVLVDNADDRYAGAFFAYFPRSVTVRPGDTVTFTQAWNGEPHSVTMGTLVDQRLPRMTEIAQKYQDQSQMPPEVDAEVKAFEAALPTMSAENSYDIHQNAAQPCFLDVGTPPSDPNTPCPRTPQPPFNGRQPYYSSGFIPYQGPQGNGFTVHLADDTAPGKYNYYCTLHGPMMSGAINVVPKAAKIPSQGAVSQAGRRQFERESDKLARSLQQVEQHKFPSFVTKEQAVYAKGKPIAGWFDPDVGEASINEFIPKTVTARVNTKVTWIIAGSHTISFGVPPYFPELTIERDGSVHFNPRAVNPVGGPGFPPEPLPKSETGIPTPIDGGTFDGTGFRSSGLPTTSDDNTPPAFSLAFSKPGTYKYACLIHPKMVGTVVVK